VTKVDRVKGPKDRGKRPSRDVLRLPRPISFTFGDLILIRSRLIGK
jgi:hypothetical protein